MPLSTTQTINAQGITAPQAGYKFYQPWFEDYQRRLGSSIFGSDGIGGLMNQPQQIPMEGTAGLTPLQMQAREAAMSAGPDMGAYNTATNLMGQGAGMIGQGADALGTAQGMYGQGTGLVGQGSGLYGLGTQMTGQAANMFAPGAAQQFYNPYEDRVIDDTLERMRKTSAQQDIAGRAQDISSGAFGGSRGRLLAGERQAESERGILEALSGIRSQGYQQAQQAAQTAGQGIGTLAGQLGQFGQGLGTLGGQLGQFGQGLTSTGGQYGQLGTQIGQLGTGVAGLGQQKSGELSNYANLLNALGTQGQTTQQSGLSRLYQAAQQRAGEPWDRAMRGMNVLGGFRPGELIGGYETKVMQPQTYQQPTSAGSTIQGIGGILGLGNTLADIGQTFGWWGSPDPSKGAQGGYVQKPRDYNAGGIVSGIVPVNMNQGGDASVEDQLKDLPPEERQSILEWIKENPIDAAAMASLAIPVARWAGVRRLGGGTLGKLVFGGRKITPKTRGSGKTKEVWSEAKDKWIDANTTQGQMVLNMGSQTTRGLTGRAKDLIMNNKLTTGLLAVAGGKRLFGGDDEDAQQVLVDSDAEIEKLREIEKAKQEEARAREKSRIFQDIVSTTGRLGEMMNAPGTRQVNFADAANIFAEERMGLPQSDQAREIEELSRMSGYSPKELLDMTDLYQGKIANKDDLKAQYINTAFERFGVNFEKHPEHMDMGGSKTGAQIRLEIMNILDMMDTDELTSIIKNLQVPTVIED
jgi:hypothetical protein